jgi:hypothetical protein
VHYVWKFRWEGLGNACSFLTFLGEVDRSTNLGVHILKWGWVGKHLYVKLLRWGCYGIIYPCV